ncbi:MAG TPA: Trp biosynthesis-associated membrane protein [Nocardioides sp.]|uniref:Trp biosynthesis-associated membrane protein n=1 Tax=Nocardioides sp. TaxID=35761 RepID=UPI002E3499C0|nr:Trp biosynthesis-associated membrane protein [Nocardioides sp.]HEX5090369.1 Trp biosynthesis-associated membrane protein [Nocardioides sp.]
MTGRRGFGAVVGAGLASAVLAAVAGRQPWAHGSAPGGLGELSATVEAGKVPAAGALSLVVLACWGVLLVTRGVVRRVVAVVGVLASLGLALAVVVGHSTAPDRVRDAYRELGVDRPDVSLSGWYWVAVVATLLTLVTTVAAVRLVPTWPEMGRKYDAPVDSASPSTGQPPGERDNLDLWKAMDEGRDPTA